MTVDIITLFPQMFVGPFDQSIVKRAKNKSLVDISLHNLREFAIDKRGTVDDRPYGGGVGMILRIEPIYAALQKVKQPKPKSKVVLMDPRGNKFTQSKALSYSKLDQLILVCGHYEGVDERVRKHLVDEAVSIGEYVLTGGEIPAMVITDAVVRLIPGVLEKSEATLFESHSTSLAGGEDLPDRQASRLPRLEHPQYTRPEEFNGWEVPEVLRSGDHRKIAQWQKENS